MAIPIGATSYVYRYLLGDARKASRHDEFLRRAREDGLEALQVCENARPLGTSVAGWRELGRLAEEIGLRLSLGCMSCDPAEVVEYLERVQAIRGNYLRIVLEREGGIALTVDSIRRFLDRMLPELEARGLRLAIENHFDIPSRVLALAADPYPAERVGFCVDVANSLRNFENTESVLKLLGPRAVCYHLKDYTVAGSNVGFAVSGTPFGDGRIGAAALVRGLVSQGEPEMFLETWTPSTGEREADVREDQRFLEISVRNLGGFLQECGSLPP